MAAVNRERFGLEVEREDAERLSADDQAAEVARVMHEAALATHRARQARLAVAQTPGVCTNCAERTLGDAVYCDVDCREDHERRQAAKARSGAL